MNLLSFNQLICWHGTQATLKTKCSCFSYKLVITISLINLVKIILSRKIIFVRLAQICNCCLVLNTVNNKQYIHKFVTNQGMSFIRRCCRHVFYIFSKCEKMSWGVTLERIILLRVFFIPK